MERKSMNQTKAYFTIWIDSDFIVKVYDHIYKYGLKMFVWRL